MNNFMSVKIDNTCDIIYNKCMYIDEYLESKKYAWSQTTLRSERFRLQAVIDQLDGNPTKLWESIQDRKPYTRATIWTRVVEYYQFLIDTDRIKGKNEYEIWRKTNARLFKNVYQTSKPEITFEEARRRILEIKEDDIREKAIQLLTAGLRFSESSDIRDGTVVGKGNKPRKVYVQSESNTTSYSRLHRALKRIGLKPHDLRKLFLTRLVDSGANEFELCEIAGWSNLNTASSYIKVSQKRIEDLVKKAVGA